MTEKIPIKIWTDEVDEKSMEQIKNIANFPFAYHHIAIMPDVHVGYGMPIGGVMATDGVVVPNAVGVDIGCGVCATRTPLKEISIEILKSILGRIRKEIPVGFKHHKKEQEEEYMPKIKKEMKIINSEYDSAKKQIGTLGGGNHFIDILKGSDGYIWIMVHSGSRNLGKKVADYYNKKAIEICGDSYPIVAKKHQLAFLKIGTSEAEDYISEMRYCVDFAFANRKLMLERIVSIFKEVADLKNDFGDIINIAHNFASLENHFGKDVWVHRKGATLADKDTIGIVPGSQGTRSYIVRGKGNPDSFNSCAHGAGRKLGRKEAQRTLDLNKEIEKLEKRGILHAVRGRANLDEASGAYKDIDEVMRDQEDLVEILITLDPIGIVIA